jgi:hypothetical protein
MTADGRGLTDLKVPPLDLVVAWLPAEDRSWSLLADAPTVLPALLYGDKITLICPESDDFMEVSDFGEIYETFGGDQQGAFDSVVELVSMESGSADGAPVFPDIWESLAERYARAATEAIAAGQRQHAVLNLARIFGLSYGAFYFDAEDHIKQLVRGADAEMMLEAEQRRHDVMARDVEPDKVASAFAKLAVESGHYGILDDPGSLLAAGSRQELSAALDRWARNRSIEATLSAEILRRLPTPTPTDEPWRTVAELRIRLREPLQRFRIAMARIAQAAESDPLDDHDFGGFSEAVFRTEVNPALAELDEITREASLRSVFVSDVAADPYSYVGPGLGLISAYAAGVPAFIAAALGTTTPIARTFSHAAERRRALRQHDYLFLQAVRRQADR